MPVETITIRSPVRNNEDRRPIDRRDEGFPNPPERNPSRAEQIPNPAERNPNSESLDFLRRIQSYQWVKPPLSNRGKFPGGKEELTEA
jgi:hypothetical protein